MGRANLEKLLERILHLALAPRQNQRYLQRHTQSIKISLIDKIKTQRTHSSSSLPRNAAQIACPELY